MLPIGGIVLAAGSNAGRQEFAIYMVVSVMVLTIGVIFWPAMLYCYYAHQKRFTRDKMVADWRVDGPVWRSWCEATLKRASRGWLITFGVILLIALGFGIFAFVENDTGWLVASGSLVGLVVILAVIAWLTTASYRQPYGHVWLSDEAIQFCSKALFLRSFGLRVLGMELREAGDIHEIAIRFAVQTKDGEVENLYTAPVPIEMIAVVRQWIEERKGRFY